MFSRTRSHAGEIALDTLQSLPEDAWEIARLWVTMERSFVAVGRQEQWSPELLGALLVECIHTAAAGYAAQGKMSEAQALELMWQGFDEERKRLGPDHSEDAQ